MESGEGGDDQGSGWMQVKKKHRSSSKFPQHDEVREISGRKNYRNPSKLSLGHKIEIKVNKSQPSTNRALHKNRNISNPTAISAEDEPVVSIGYSAATTPDSNSNSTVSLQQSDKEIIFPKIKWGDLDEGTLEHYCNTSGSGITFGGIKSHDMIPINNVNSSESLPDSYQLDPNEQKNVGETTEENQVFPESHSSSPEIPYIEETCKEVNEVPHEDIKEQIISEQIVSPSGDSIERETGGELITTASVDESVGENLQAQSEGLEEPQSTDAMSLDVTDESKERFRERLWCFLFENLNRAVDELYLLCELECDIGQMKEASLVLEEAASDFRELKCRVEKFEKSKNPSSHGSEGTPLMMQSDHRRPHALSWEVRRMTTSPRRAEILSSSLEAFRKIQQERSSERDKNAERLGSDSHCPRVRSTDTKQPTVKPRKQTGVSDISDSSGKEKRNLEMDKSVRTPPRLPRKDGSYARTNGKNIRENTYEQNPKSADPVRRHVPFPEREREKNRSTRKSMDAWKEKRNWEDVLASPYRVSSRSSYSPSMRGKSAERVRVLHDKLMSPEKKKKSGVDLKKEAEEKHARATRIRIQLENERVQKLQKTSEKLSRVNELQNIRSNKLRESIFARYQRGESRHEAHLAQVVRRAGDESSKVNEVRFITSLNEENKKHIYRKKLEDSELRRADKLQIMKTKQKEDMAREEAVLERRRLIEAEKLQRIEENKRKKEEAQVRKEEERKASSAAREAKAIENLKRKEIRAKARQEEAELMAQKLAERLRESEQRRKIYLEQIRERASMDFRDQASPFWRRFTGKEGQSQGRSTSNSNTEDLANCAAGAGILTTEALQHSLKRRIKKIRQRLMSLKHEFYEPSVGPESSSIGYRTAMGTARGKIARWLQDLQKLRQARKEGAANFGLITSEMIKFLEGKEAELQASRQAGLLDFIASALPASHTSKPEGCQVTIYLLRLLRIVLAMPANRCYFLGQNLLPPIIPMLAAALENYIKMAASSTNIPSQANSALSKTSSGNLEFVSEIVDGFLWTIGTIIGYPSCNDKELQMQDGLVELVIAYQITHRLRDLFALYDRPQVEGSPFPSSILLSINLLVVLTSKFRESSPIDWESFPCEAIQGNELEITNVNRDHTDEVEHVASTIKTVDVVDESVRVTNKCESSSVEKSGSTSVANGAEQISGNASDSKRPVTFLLSAMAETGLVCLPSMLTAVLLQANNRSAEQGSFSLPSNFEEVATGVLKVLNNLALIDVTFIQKLLARPDLKMEFFHLMGFLLSHCTTNWAIATDKTGLLLLESLSLLGYFALFHRGNQAVLRWGKSPTILHKVCDLPFVFFSDPELMPVLAGTLVAVSYGCEQNKAIIQQELSMEMLIPSLKSCKINPLVEDSLETSEPEFRNGSLKLSRNSMKSGRSVPFKVGAKVKGRNQRDSKMKFFGEITPNLMLHCRFPVSFIDKAEEFFSAETKICDGDSV